MIGTRGAVLGLAAAFLAGAAVGPGGPDPSWAVAADARTLAAAQRADASLAALEGAIEAALEPARRGAARTVSGDELPGAWFGEAADVTRAAQDRLDRALAALDRLESARRADDPDAVPLDPPIPRGELASIAAQLEATADAADVFAEMRLRAGVVITALDRSLGALADERLAEARLEVDRARSAFGMLEEWEVDLPTLPVWMETTSAMIVAVEMLVDATASGDADRATRAAAAFADASADAAVAGRALRIATSEGGAAVSAPALARLAGVLSRAGETRAQVAVILQADGR